MPDGVDGLSGDDVIKKYVEEIVVIVSGKVYSNASDLYESGKEGLIHIPIKFNSSEKDICDMTVVIDPILSIEKLKEFLFNQMFQVFTFVSDTMMMPADAAYVPDRP